MSTPTITAAQVKELRDRTGAGMMDCKNALAETDGDLDKARRAAARAPRRQGPEDGRPRGHRGHDPVLHPRQRQGRRARRGRLQHRLRRPQRRLHRVRPRGRAAHRRLAHRPLRQRGRDPGGRPARPSCASSSSRPPTSPRTSAPRSPRASCASGPTRSSCCGSSTSTPTSTTARRSSNCAPSCRARRGRTSSSAASRASRSGPSAREPARVRAHPAQAVGGGADGRSRLRHRPGPCRGDRRPDQGRARPRRRGRGGASAAATSCVAQAATEQGMDGATGDYMGMLATVINGLDAPGRARAPRRAHARADRDHDLRGRRAVHPAPRDPPPREGARRDLRGRHRQPVLHDRHRRARCARSRSTRRRS